MNSTKTIVNEVVVDSQPMLIDAQRLSAHLSSAHSSMGEFLITKGDKARQNFQNSMYEAGEVLNEMEQLPIVIKTASFQQNIDEFRQGLVKYQSYEKRILALSKDTQKNYPATDYAANNLNTPSSEFLSLVGQMIESEAEEDISSERVIWLNIL